MSRREPSLRDSGDYGENSGNYYEDPVPQLTGMETRSVAASRASTHLSRVRVKAELATLRAAQAKKAAEAKLEADQAKLAADRLAAARTTQDLADQAEILQLERRLLEADVADAASHTPSRDMDAFRPTCPPAESEDGRERTMRWVGQAASFVPENSPQQQPATAPRVDDGRRRGVTDLPVTSSWVDDFRRWPVADARPAAPGRYASLPRLTLEKFDGTPTDWPRWSALFRALVHDQRSMTDIERMAHLQSSVQGQAKEAIEGLLCDGALYHEALDELERRFGNPGLVVQANLAKLRELPTVKENDLQSLQKLATTLHCVVSVLERLGYDSDLTATSNLEVALRKLPVSLAWRWGERVVEFGQRPPTLADFDKWLSLQTAAARSVQWSSDKTAAGTRHLSSDKTTAGARQRGAETTIKKVSAHTLSRVADTARGADTSNRPGINKGKVDRPDKVKTKSDHCACCGDICNQLEQCAKFQKMTVSERVTVAKDHTLCFRCLLPNHKTASCGAQTQCEVDDCGKWSHHTLLHGGWARRDAETRAEVNTAGTCTGTVLLQHIPVTVYGPTGQKAVNALLDLGSQVSLIDEETAVQIGLSGGKTETLHLGTVDAETKYKSRRVKFQIRSHQGTSRGSVHNVSALTLSALKLHSPQTNWPTEREKWPHLAELDLPAPIDTDRTQLLLGADVFSLIVPREVREGPQGTPSAVRTELGWTVSGRHHPESEKGDYTRVYVTQRRANTDESDCDLDRLVKDFWRTESFGTKYLTPPGMSKDNQRAEQILNETTRWTGACYETGLLWKQENLSLPDSKPTAIRRLKSLEKTLVKTGLAATYAENLQSYITKGYCRKLSTAEVSTPNAREWYLPHHAVTSPAKPGKVRVVFDAAARSCGISLNDNLLAGPDQLNSLIGVLMRFRLHPVAITADIREMFHQVLVREEDRPSLRFLWRNMEHDRPPDVYEMRVLIFGATSSPCSATHALRRCASDNVDKYPEAAAAVLSRFYVDDLLTSVDTEVQAIHLQASLTEMLDSAGFHLTKWNSSSPAVLDSVAECDRRPVVSLDLENPTCVRALGVNWNVGDDSFTFKVIPADVPHTKRALLSRVSTVFDPLGLLAPLILPAKCLLQSLWLRGYDWDEPIADERLICAWKQWCSDLTELEKVRVPRCYHPQGVTVLTRELHVFGDASEKAFGAVAYFRLHLDDGQLQVAFIAAKTRVAPLKQLTIPRLELQAAVMCVRLAETVRLEHDCVIDSVTFWSDSQTVLKWIRSESRKYHTFVANRVAEIQDASSISSWRFVPGCLNPSDISSRGCTAAELAESSWFTGPAFLSAPKDVWPTEQPKETTEEDVEAKILLTTNTSENCDPPPLLASEKYSSWLRLLRTTAWIKRFCYNARAETAGRRSGPITSKELQDAEILWFQRAQNDAFRTELDALQRNLQVPRRSRLNRLQPYKDERNLIRVGGRLKRAQVPQEAQHQIILPADHHVTRLIISDRHRRLAHVGPEHVLSDLRQRIWVTHGRAAVKGVINACPTCRRRRAVPKPPVMADLPAERVNFAAPAFSYVGCDFFGPMTVKRFRKTEKRYGCLFTCLVTRAVHLEVAHKMDTDSFLMCIRRLIARRGKPQKICSDNGTNLKSAERELRQGIRQWNQEQLSDKLTQEGIDWSFIPPSAPHFGGAWERMVQSTKRAFKAVLGNSITDDEMLLTVITEVEGLLNSRPLTHVSTDPDDFEALTPNHLLIGRLCIPLPPGVFTDADLCSRRRWRHAQRQVDHFWKRWRKEYLPTLQSRRKWTTEQANMQPGDLVLIIEDSPRGLWPLARVMEVHPGADGRVRSATVKTATGVYDRPVVKLCVLEGDQTAVHV